MPKVGYPIDIDVTIYGMTVFQKIRGKITSVNGGKVSVEMPNSVNAFPVETSMISSVSGVWWVNLQVKTYLPMQEHISCNRVSTERQGQSGLGQDAQRAAVAGYLRRPKAGWRVRGNRERPER